MITQEQFDKAKQFIFRHGRLFDRKRFSFHFEDGSSKSALESLLCYQNPDGGFGHGIELDVLCPASTAIGAETAMYYLEDLGIKDGEKIDRLENWILSAQQDNGTVPHPENEIKLYPHGPWWLGDDDIRVFSLAGMLGKWGRGSELFFQRVENYFENYPFPEKFEIYTYPLYLYLRFAPGMEKHTARLEEIRCQLPNLLEKFKDYYPLFSPYWSYASDDVSREILKAEAEKMVDDLQDDGGLKFAYPDLPWWRPVVTLEGLVALKKHGFLNILQGG